MSAYYSLRVSVFKGDGNLRIQFLLFSTSFVQDYSLKTKEGTTETFLFNYLIFLLIEESYLFVINANCCESHLYYETKHFRVNL